MCALEHWADLISARALCLDRLDVKCLLTHVSFFMPILNTVFENKTYYIMASTNSKLYSKLYRKELTLVSPSLPGTLYLHLLFHPTLPPHTCPIHTTAPSCCIRRVPTLAPQASLVCLVRPAHQLHHGKLSLSDQVQQIVQPAKSSTRTRRHPHSTASITFTDHPFRRGPMTKSLRPSSEPFACTLEQYWLWHCHSDIVGSCWNDVDTICPPVSTTKQLLHWLITFDQIHVSTTNRTSRCSS
jgi:hypothetical protein